MNCFAIFVLPLSGAVLRLPVDTLGCNFGTVDAELTALADKLGLRFHYIECLPEDTTS